MDFVPYVRISKKYCDFQILENNEILTRLLKIIEMLVMVEKQNDSLKVHKFLFQIMGKNTA